ncbi:MAG: arylesterase [Pseudomonadota bacterium]
MISDVTRTLKLLAVVVLVCASNPAYTKENTIVVFGDSISAAYGMEQDEGWVNLLAKRIAQNGLPWTVVNASVSGETSGGGLVRLPKTLELHQPDLLILELGGNDGLRGYPIARIRDNLSSMVEQSQQVGASVLLIGMVLPPNYGRRYIQAFEGIFPEVAEQHGVPLIPFLLDGIATPASLVQRDGIHPRPEAQPMIMEQVWQALAGTLMAGPQETSEKIELQGGLIGDQ